jgi:hypothetical protein
MALKKKVKQELEKINVLKQIKNILSSVILGEIRNDYKYAESTIPIIKELLIDTVNKIWKIGKSSLIDYSDQSSISPDNKKNSGYDPTNLSQDKYTPNRSVGYKDSEKKIIIKNNFNIEKFSQKSPNKFKQVTSEFSYSRGPTFSKSIREIDKKVIVTPGPSSYIFEKVSIRQSPPKTIFPTVGKRDSYIPTTYSPGPGKYYSSIHFLAKS